MAKIDTVVGVELKGKYAIAHVIIDDGTEASVFIGGDVELYHDPAHDVVKAFVKKSRLDK